MPIVVNHIFIVLVIVKGHYGVLIYGFSNLVVKVNWGLSGFTTHLKTISPTSRTW